MTQERSAQRTLLSLSRPISVAFIVAVIALTVFLAAVANNWHQRGLALATCGALLLAVDPFLKLLRNREINRLLEGNTPPATREALIQTQMKLFVEHSSLAFWSTMIGVIALAFGFLIDFYSESAKSDSAEKGAVVQQQQE